MSIRKRTIIDEDVLPEYEDVALYDTVDPYSRALTLTVSLTESELLALLEGRVSGDYAANYAEEAFARRDKERARAIARRKQAAAVRANEVQRELAKAQERVSELKKELRELQAAIA